MQLICKFSFTLCPCQLNHEINVARRQQDCLSSTSLFVVGFQGNRDYPWERQVHLMVEAGLLNGRDGSTYLCDETTNGRDRST